ncbi:MAG: hypothetical protein KKB39_02650 [Nanoarchaeota archaeon]|nr:hypothetical protein [Nanoarchaeota archaeon]
MIESKKGAIEMSMQTIIIVVIGVTLLTLGLRFVYTTFTGITEQQEGITELTNTQINELFGQSGELIYLTKDNVGVQQGDTETIAVNVLNTDYDDGIFKYDVRIADSGKMTEEQVKGWFTWTRNGRTLKNGQGYKDNLVLRVPKDARTGAYLIELELDCPSEMSCAFAQFLVEVEAS